jgi:hypothetical protein
VRFAVFAELSGYDLGGSTRHRHHAESILDPIGTLGVKHAFAERSAAATDGFCQMSVTL